MRAVAVVTLSLGLSLAITGGLGWFGDGLQHWTLIVHLGAAPLFLIGAILTGFAWVTTPLGPLRRLATWIVLAGVVTGTTAVLLAMVPRFGQDAIHTLIEVHRWAAVGVAAGAALHLSAGALIRSRAPEPTPSDPEGSSDVPTDA